MFGPPFRLMDYDFWGAESCSARRSYESFRIMRRAWVVGVIATLATACESGSGPPPATAIAVTPADTAIAWNSSVRLTATVRYGDGLPIPAAGPFANLVAWSSASPNVATVSRDGVVHRTGGSGVATINASQGFLSAWSQVTVLDSMIFARAKVPDRSYAAAISIHDVAFVSQSDRGQIKRVDLHTQAITDTIQVGDQPTEMAFNATGTRLYVTNQYSNSVMIIDVATDAVIDTIPVGNRPFEIIVAPGDSILWVAKIDSLYAVRIGTEEIISRFQIGDVGNGVGIAHDTLLYVSTHATGTVVEVNLKTRALGRTFAVGGVPQKLVVSPDGSELYIANQDGYIQFWDLDTGLQIGSNLPLPSGAYGLARRSSDGLLYATSAYFGGGYLYVIDPVTRTLVHSTIIGGSTRHIVFTIDGSRGIIPNEGGWVDFMR